jgi:rubrerythrin
VKRVFSSHNVAVVHHFRNMLQAEGIRAVVKNEFLSSALGDLPPAECQAELRVLSERDAERAARVFGALQAVADTAWTCPSCGEKLEPQFTQCWSCGTTRA